MATRHRKDLTQADFQMLASFCHALEVVFINTYSPVYELSVLNLKFPTWFVSGGGVWKLAGYREYQEPAIGISKNHMEQVCSGYLGLSMNDVLNTLYKFSILAVTPDTQATDTKPHFRQPFTGIRREYYGMIDEREHIKHGFILEKRRAIGGFRKVVEHGP